MVSFCPHREVVSEYITLEEGEMQSRVSPDEMEVDQADAGPPDVSAPVEEEQAMHVDGEFVSL
jgi:hypothetical protein